MTRHQVAFRCWAALLAAVAVGGLAYLLAVRGRRSASTSLPTVPAVVWAFEAHKRGAVLSTPLATGERIYVAASHDPAFTNSGAVYCLDGATGKPLWSFDDGGQMQHTFSSPSLAGGRLYVGEGMHANFVCKLYCLDAETGGKLWDFSAAGHIESSPCVSGGKVYFGAGDDGVYCLDAVTGLKLWKFAGPFHIDSAPAVAEGRVFVGSGVSRLKRATEAICLGADDGRVIWRFATDLPVWGSPRLSGDDVFFGLGNGRLLTGPEPPDTPAGALLCLSASSGRLRWRADLGEAVFGRPAACGERVFVGTRGGLCHALDRHTGQAVWRRDLGSPVVASPALVGDRLYVVASGGKVSCLDAATGRDRWTFDVAAHGRAEANLLSSPVVAGDEAGRRILLGAELRNATSGAAVVYCLRD